MQFINIRNRTLELVSFTSWTVTINNWYKLLQEDAVKEVIIPAWKHLSFERKIEVYAFVFVLSPATYKRPVFLITYFNYSITGFNQA